MAAWIEQIKREFASGKTFVEIVVSDNPRAFRKLLDKAARRRGLAWGFAVCENSVFVYPTL